MGGSKVAGRDEHGLAHTDITIYYKECERYRGGGMVACLRITGIYRVENRYVLVVLMRYSYSTVTVLSPFTAKSR